MTTTDVIACLKVTLDDVEPVVMRRIEVPQTIRLDRLHLVLQAAMGWTNTHLWEFRAGEKGWGVPDPDWADGPDDAAEATLVEALRETRVGRLTYLYDFGDGWEHTIRVEYIVAPAPGGRYPQLFEAIGRCPPEDIGGPPGYEEFLAAIHDPGHERHAEFTESHDAEFNPATVDVDGIRGQLAVLAKRWSRKPTKRKTS